MEVTQSYARPSSASMSPEGLRLDVSAELSRPKVALDAMVRDSLAYARLMLALYAVVSGDHRVKPKDHAAYQAWVEQRYLEELSTEMGARLRTLPGLNERRDALKARLADLRKISQPLEQKLNSADFMASRQKYFKWLWDNDKTAWMILDPVVSVHPDCVVFEVFSIDESSYGRVTVPMDKLDVFGETVFGTTNVDYSRALADEIRRVRDYRPAFIQIAGEGVTVATGAGEHMEKKIDLPPTWVRGFLQVQSAAAFSGVDVTLSAETVAEVLAALRRRREDKGPRSLRFVLAPGEKPKIVIEPWNIEVLESEHVFEGSYSGDIRIWGRRRLFVLESLMPHAEKVQARLLGTGMPSYWTVFLKDHRFDLGLSGWTQNDWSRAARFDLLASTGSVSDGDIAQAAQTLETRLKITPEELAASTDMSREAATTALQKLTREGRAMYDLAGGVYRWRQLLPFPVPEENESDQRLNLARRLVATGGVKWLKPGEDDEEESFGIPDQREQTTRYRAQVRGGEEKRERKFHVVLDLDADGRARFVQCNCSWHRREKLRKGPCAHILAATVLASQQSVGAGAAQTESSGSSSGGAALRPDRFKGQNFVFTGALTIFTREQAEALVAQGGGKASGSVSRTTTYLVAGDKAGSKLTKARDLGVPVLTEQQFQAMLEDRA
ncbi:MAG: BRCT domain-containing protein [Capsulimonas sp.]|uniref:SWIM zinc finger family protein n=1 Tax=Capsulimonas sp. TaxID=2494211 RepID=UPI00326489EE